MSIQQYEYKNPDYQADYAAYEVFFYKIEYFSHALIWENFISLNVRNMNKYISCCEAENSTRHVYISCHDKDTMLINFQVISNGSFSQTNLGARWHLQLHKLTRNIHALERKACHFEKLVITGGTISCHYGNLWCLQWWQSCQIEDLRVFSERGYIQSDLM